MSSLLIPRIRIVMLMDNVIISSCIVILASLIIVLIELFKTFGEWVAEALRHPRTWLLIALNVVVALVVYSLVIASGMLNSYPRHIAALIVGLTYPILLRSRFTYLSGFNSGNQQSISKDLCLPLDEAYNVIQNYCLRAAAVAVALKTVHEANNLMNLYTEDQLIRTIKQLSQAIKIKNKTIALCNCVEPITEGRLRL